MPLHLAKKSLKKELSTNKRIKLLLPQIFRRRSEISIYKLCKLLEDELGMRLRTDWIVCNLLGEKNLLIDCETYRIYKVDPHTEIGTK